MFLPPESLVPFKARRLANAETVYLNPQYRKTHEDWLDKYAYLIPGENHCSDDFFPQEKEFLAERYGGGRIVTHGGGVRCGLDGTHSVKGIGCNPLMGKDSLQLDFAHSHGGLPLSGAIQEAIWGNIFDIALPFGAVRVAAIILTGTDCVNRFRQKAPAALVVREAALRPAHFERAAYFLPQSGVPLATDVERVKKAIAFLPDSLPMPATLSADDINLLSPIEKLQLGLGQFAERLAAQSATAVSRRLLHGGLTASNMGLDGRWLDFGTAMAFSTYANAILGDGGLPSLWEEHLKCVPALQNLCFYINKYYPAEDESQLPQAQQLLQIFITHYQSWLIRAFVNLTGFPETLWQAHSSQEEAARLAALLIEVATEGVKKVFITATPDWEKFESNRLGQVLPVLALWHDHDSCELRLQQLISNPVVRRELIAAYSRLAIRLINTDTGSGVNPQSMRRFVYFNAAKIQKNIASIEAGSVFSRYLQKEHVSTEEIQFFVDSVTDEAQVLYVPPSIFECLMWKAGGTEILYDAASNQWKRVCNQQQQVFSWEALGREEQLLRMSDYWGDTHWSKLSDREGTTVEQPLMENVNA